MGWLVGFLRLLARLIDDAWGRLVMRLAQQRIGKETETFRECFRVEIDSLISTALLDSLAFFIGPS